MRHALHHSKHAGINMEDNSPTDTQQSAERAEITSHSSHQHYACPVQKTSTFYSASLTNILTTCY